MKRRKDINDFGDFPQAISTIRANIIIINITAKVMTMIIILKAA